jgi:hypothetical protein
VLRSGSGNKVDIEQIKKAAALVRAYKGKAGDAVAAVQQVGRLVEDCGGVEKAVKAVEAYQELAKSLGTKLTFALPKAEANNGRSEG